LSIRKGKGNDSSSSCSILNFSTGVPRPESRPTRLLNIVLARRLLLRLIRGATTSTELTDETVELRPLFGDRCGECMRVRTVLVES
jgi:hypothetical protein